MGKLKVVDNHDPLKMGRVLIADGKWLYPISEAHENGEFNVPEVGDEIVVVQDCYVICVSRLFSEGQHG